MALIVTPGNRPAALRMFGDDPDPLKNFGCDHGGQIGVSILKELREAVEVGKCSHLPFQRH